MNFKSAAEEALKQSMEAKSKEFVEKGGEVYLRSKAKSKLKAALNCARYHS